MDNIYYTATAFLQVFNFDRGQRSIDWQWEMQSIGFKPFQQYSKKGNWGLYIAY